MADRLASARRVVERERRECGDEREAFRAFRRRVGELTPTRVPATRRAPRLRHTDGSLDSVREAYEETVMSVPHYDREYGDGYAQSLATEFGNDVAAAVFGSQTLTAELQDALTAAARSAATDRAEFLDLLDREAESVAVADAELDELRDDLVALDSTPSPTAASTNSWSCEPRSVTSSRVSTAWPPGDRRRSPPTDEPSRTSTWT
ncbi:hypothetical protein ACFQJD_05685 [Haloplanus sp. GCM10025708]|uniref:DUF7260 family protein n=1 Tax=Haloplanus sp. GCM10025708 TaxID=3252679 RepID=UPI00361D7467